MTKKNLHLKTVATNYKFWEFRMLSFSKRSWDLLTVGLSLISVNLLTDEKDKQVTHAQSPQQNQGEKLHLVSQPCTPIIE